MFNDATVEEINAAVENSWNAFRQYAATSIRERAALMRSIALEIERLGDELLTVAAEETSLPEARLRAERSRTIFQLNSYAEACETGRSIEARIDKADPERNPPKPDIRKMRVPLGPVVVFGAANFPFAYSTAGGDTASALAAGCTVIVKAHPAHPRTSEMVAGAIHKAVASALLPAGVFIHLYGASNEVGRALVEHPLVKAVGFTGSQAGGRQLFDWANQRPVPIPVFAEMSSINPVFLLPGKLSVDAVSVAEMYASSITLGVGQFCTNPGLIIAIEDDSLVRFQNSLAESIRKTMPGRMLHPGIFRNYVETRANVLSQQEVTTLAVSDSEAQFNEGVATIASVPASEFLSNPLLHREVFGPFSLIVACKSYDEMLQVASHLEGQLTATLIGNDEDLRRSAELIATVKLICGRMIINSVPTGVEVTAAMHHGGPYPATTDARFTSVGEDAIKRFSRPLAFQNWPEEFLPEELRATNYTY